MEKYLINMKITIEHIPRCIFGVSYTKKCLDGSIIRNNLELMDTYNQQLRYIKTLKEHPEAYSEIKELKYLIKEHQSIGDESGA